MEGIGLLPARLPCPLQIAGFSVQAIVAAKKIGIKPGVIRMQVQLADQALLIIIQKQLSGNGGLNRVIVPFLHWCSPFRFSGFICSIAQDAK